MPKNKIMNPDFLWIWSPHEIQDSFSEAGLCVQAFISVFWCLLRSKLILWHFIQLRNSFLYPVTYFDETWGNPVFWGTPSIRQT